MSDAVNPETAFGEESHEHFLPPATFEALVQSMVMQAQFVLVSYEDEKGRHDPDLPVARHYIDLLSMLLEKTRGNLAMDEQRLLENALTELRFRYVQAFEDTRKAVREIRSRPGVNGAEDHGFGLRHEHGGADHRMPLRRVHLAGPTR